MLWVEYRLVGVGRTLLVASRQGIFDDDELNCDIASEEVDFILCDAVNVDFCKLLAIGLSDVTLAPIFDLGIRDIFSGVLRIRFLLGLIGLVCNDAGVLLVDPFARPLTLLFLSGMIGAGEKLLNEWLLDKDECPEDANESHLSFWLTCIEDEHIEDVESFDDVDARRIPTRSGDELRFVETLFGRTNLRADDGDMFTTFRRVCELVISGLRI